MKKIFFYLLVCLACAFSPAHAEREVIQYADGGRYEGETLNGQRHGKGIYIYPNGGIYTGEWQHGKKYGWGLYKWPGGNRYEGEWRNNVRHGRGTLIFADGGIYTGVWVNGETGGRPNQSAGMMRRPGCPPPPANICAPDQRKTKAAGMCAWILGGCRAAAREIGAQVDPETAAYFNSQACPQYIRQLQSEGYNHVEQLVGSFVVELTQTIAEPLLAEARESPKAVSSLLTSAAGAGLRPFVGESTYAEFQSCVAEAEMECSRKYEQWKKNQVCQ